MPRSLRKTLLWQGVGLLFTMAGMLVFLVVAVGAYLAPPANSFENLAAGDVVVLVVSVVLLVAGRVVAWRYGGSVGAMGSVDAIRNRGPRQSQLEELGYRMPAEERPDSDSEYDYDDGELSVQCPECGAKNETGFDYCGECSARLPE